MPELPEVETVVRGIRPLLVGQSVHTVWCDREKQLKGITLSMLRDRILHQQFIQIYRRAKYIVCDLTHDTLIIHLKMTGRLYVCIQQQIMPPFQVGQAQNHSAKISSQIGSLRNYTDAIGGSNHYCQIRPSLQELETSMLMNLYLRQASTHSALPIP